MNKNVLILSGSPRKGGNSDLLCDEFLKGALESGNQAEKIFVTQRNISPCSGCYFCTKSGGKCAINDGFEEILQKMIDADVIVLASPVYFYSINAQLKAVIDRTVARWTEIKNKDFYYIATAAEKGDSALKCTIDCMRGFADCVDGAKEKGVIMAGGFYEKGEIINSKHMKAAYEMGKNC